MRHLPKFSDDYGLAGDQLAEAAILSADLDVMLDSIGDDWSLEDTEELEIVAAH